MMMMMIKTGIDIRGLLIMFSRQIAQDHLKTVKVDVQNDLDKVEAIYKGNSNNSITVKGNTVNYESPSADKTTTCCDYEFLVLNTKCKNDVSNTWLP